MAQSSLDKKEKKKKKKAKVGGSLSFADEGDGEEEEEVVKRPKLGKNPNVDTGFLPDKDRDDADRRKREELARAYQQVDAVAYRLNASACFGARVLCSAMPWSMTLPNKADATAGTRRHQGRAHRGDFQLLGR